MTARKPQSAEQDDAEVQDDMPADGTGSQPEDTGEQEQAGEPENTDAPGAAPGGLPAPVRAAPPFYIATEPLFVGTLQGAWPVRAYNAGDKVAADVVEINGWTGKVAHPDDTENPAPAATDSAVTAGQEQDDDDTR